jgi:hypothetical protein
VFVRFGADSTLYLSICLLNALCVWALWIHAPSQPERRSRTGAEVDSVGGAQRSKGTDRTAAAPLVREDSRTASEDESSPKITGAGRSAHDTPNTIRGLVNGEAPLRNNLAVVAHLTS